MKRLIAIAALIAPLCAHAWSFEAGTGVTAYQTEDGRWYQRRMPVSNVTKLAPEFSVGAVGNVLSRGAWGVDWHLDYVNLGRAAASCTCTSDEAYAEQRVDVLARFSGSGRPQGVALTIEPYRWYGGVRFGAEIGAYAYHWSWDEAVTQWSTGQPDIFVSAQHWAAAPVVGVSVGDAVWTLSYRHYFMKQNNAGRTYPPLWNDANVIEIKRRF